MIWKIVALAGAVLTACAAALVFTFEDGGEPRQPIGEAAPAPDSGTGSAKPFFAATPERPAAPTEPFRDGGGEEVALADFRGKIVLVNLWATWCAPCVKELPLLARLQAKRGGADFIVIALNMDRPGKANVPEFLKDAEAAALEPFADPSMKLMRAFRVAGLPTTILIDAEGREIARREGEADWDTQAAWAEIQKALEK